MIGRWTQAMRRPTLLAYAASPLWIAHRGDAMRYPEDTTEAYALAVASGLDVIEQDVQLLSDGALAVMHDPTVDRTTTSTGNVSSFNTASWLALDIDAGTWFGGGFANDLVPPLMPGVIAAHRGDAVLCPEAKASDVGSPLVSALRAGGVSPERAIVQAFNASWLGDAIAHGYRAMLLSADGSEDKATVWAAGVRIVCVSAAVSDATFSAWVAYGFRVLAYTVDRRYMRDRLLGLGVTGFFSNDVHYARASAPSRTTDNFATGTWERGMLAASSGYSEPDRGRFSGSGYWGWSTSTGFAYVLQGYLCPVASPSAFTFDLKVTFDSAAGGDATRWAAVFVGTTDYRFDSAADGVSNGYNFLVRKNGSIQVYRYDAGVVTGALATTATAAIADGAEVSYRVTVTPTQVSIARLSGTTGTATASDATYRGGYIHLGKSGLACRFRDLAVSL